MESGVEKQPKCQLKCWKVKIQTQNNSKSMESERNAGTKLMREGECRQNVIIFSFKHSLLLSITAAFQITVHGGASPIYLVMCL